VTMKPNMIIDTRGLFCPIPVIKTSEALKNIEGGTLVEVISDDPAIEFDMPAWCESTGHTIVLMTREGTSFRYIIKKS
jgi:tRNA 2-thiouridine synthesizing protein A